MSEKTAREVYCRYCGAEIGEACRTESKRTTTPHIIRIMDAKMGWDV